jgi:phi LC3 family holin
MKEVLSMKQNRFKSKVLWASIVAQVIVILQLTGAFKAMGLDLGVVNNVIASVLQLLVLIGVLNDPTTADSL